MRSSTKGFISLTLVAVAVVLGLLAFIWIRQQQLKKNQEKTTNENNQSLDLSKSAESEKDKDLPSDPLCPHRTDSYKVILKCPRVPRSIKEILKRNNYHMTKDSCELSAGTSDFTLGSNFIAWTTSESNSCENKTYPNGLPEDKTYDLKDAGEVVFSRDFDIKNLEKNYLVQVDLKSGFNKQGASCPTLNKRNRLQNLGHLDSELTKAQFRLVDDESEVYLEVKSFAQNSRGDICTYPLKVKPWELYLFESSRFYHHKKPAEIFRP